MARRPDRAIRDGDRVRVELNDHTELDVIVTQARSGRGSFRGHATGDPRHEVLAHVSDIQPDRRTRR